ncbi:MAG: hypothetical protein Q8P50_11640 [Bacillota bacterium]|nr:hypothetical protein [Bacillota bacterium]
MQSSQTYQTRCNRHQPGIAFDTAQAGDASIVPHVILDRRHGFNHLGAYLKRCFDYWESRLRRQTPLSGEQMDAIRQLLRGNFDFVPPIGYWIQETEQRLALEETDERQRYLDFIEEEPRIMLRGVAGSGKTSLSIAYALRRVLAGDSVLYVCFNKNLRGFLEGCLDSRVNLYTFTTCSTPISFPKGGPSRHRRTANCRATTTNERCPRRTLTLRGKPDSSPSLTASSSMRGRTSFGRPTSTAWT